MRVNIKKVDYLGLSIVVILDPIEINKLSIDSLKEKIPFDFISYVTKEALLLGSVEKKLKVTLRSNKFEFVDENKTPFQERDTSYLGDIFNSLTATLSVKAFGINIVENVTLEGVDNASKFMVDNFLKDKESIEKKVERPVFSYSIRLFLGEAKDYFDLRIHPLELQSGAFNIQFHYHNDTNIVDIEKLMQKINEKRKLTIEELPKNLNKLLGI